MDGIKRTYADSSDWFGLQEVFVNELITRKKINEMESLIGISGLEQVSDILKNADPREVETILKIFFSEKPSFNEDYLLVFKSLVDLIKPLNRKFSQALDDICSSDLFQFLNKTSLDALHLIVNHAIVTKEFDRFFHILFNPRIATEDEKEIYRRNHKEIYKKPAEEITNRIIEFNKENDNGYLVRLKSGMFSGKSTLARFICQRLEKFGYKVFVLVPDFMNEHEVTIRGEVEQGANGSQPIYKKIPALSIGKEKDENYWESVVSKIIDVAQTEKVIVHFDEYSFMSSDIIEKIISKLKDNGVNIILAGLDRNALGSELEGFKCVDELGLNYDYICRSFLPGEIDDRDPHAEGTHTSRHIKFGQMYLADFGFADIVIPKGNSFVAYTPSRKRDHLDGLLEERYSKLLNEVQNNDSQIDQAYRLRMKMELMKLDNLAMSSEGLE